MRNIFKFVIAVLILCNAAIINHASAQGLNNGLIRSGNGAENSVNSLGTLQQPWYYNGNVNTWFKLTYASYPLDYAIRIGGVGTSEWNLNGTLVMNPVLTGQTINTAGFTATGAFTGYGTVISTGTISVAGQSFLIEQFYALPPGSAYLQIKTKITNTSATVATNVRIWLGTRDDWVGNNDGPTKVKGNLVNGAFVSITSAAQQSRAMQIISGQEAVFVFTPSTRGYMINQYCCAFNNVINQNPLTVSGVVNGPTWTGDGSYGFYVRMNDLNPNQSDEFTWYYAAGSLANITDIIAQVATASGAVSNIACTGATYNATTNVAGTGYYIVVPDNAAAPTAQQIKNGVNYGSVTVVASGSGAIPANVSTPYNITGLSPNTAYKVYFVSQDAALVFSSIANSSFTTLQPAAFSACPANISVNNTAGQCNAVVTYTAPVTGNPAPSVSYTFTGATTGSGSGTGSGSTFNKGVTNVTINATNACGNVNCSFTVTVNDTQAPTITCAAPVTINTTPGLCTGTTTLTPPTVSDNCTGIGNALNFDGINDFVDAGNISSTNFGTGNFTVEFWIKTNTAPAANSDIVSKRTICDPSNFWNIKLNNNGRIFYEAIQDNSFTNYAFLETTSSVVDGQWHHLAVTRSNGLVSIYIDGALNRSANLPNTNLSNSDPVRIGRGACSDFPYGGYFKGSLDEVRIWGTVRTQAQIQANMNNELNAQAGLVAAYHFNQGVAAGNNAVITTAIDASGNGNNGTLNNFALTGTTSNWIGGNVPSAPTVTNNAPATYPIGNTTVTWTATDASNNTATCTQVVTVVDNQAPATPTLPNVTVGECSGTPTAPTTTDNCAGTITGTTTTVFPITTQGTTVVTWTFNDGNGNSTTANQNVIVDDVTPPVTPTLADVTVGECSGTPVAPTTTDVCAGTITGTTTTVFPITTQGTTVVTWTFNDGNGNSTTANQNVIVDDVTPPVTPTLADVTVGECSGTPVTPTTTDVCAGTITGTTTTVFPITTQGTTVVTWTFNDGNGNSTTANQNVIINDVTNPVITCPANTFVQYGNDESPAANGTATATDNCVSVSVGTPSDVTVNGPNNNKTITRTWTATDGAGNTATCNQTITVCDMGVSLGNNRYVFFGIPGSPGASGVLTATVSGGLTGVTYLWSSTDVSVNGLTTQSVTPTGYTDAQAVTYTVTATAPNGCTATATVTITYFNINCSNNGNTVKVKVCHIPQGNPTNCNTICVSINAYQTLLNNGSYLGQCLPNCALPPTNFRGSVDIEDYIIKPAVKLKEEDKIKDELFDVKVLNNPTAGSFILKVSGTIKDKVSIRIMDMNGMLVEQQTNLNAGQEIQIGNRYISGTYFAEITQGANRKVVKLVKLN